MDLASTNLLAVVPEIQARAMRGIVLLGIDFDGTLVGYQDRPERVRLDARLRDLLVAIRDQGRIRIAILSGRTLEDLVLCVGLDAIAYAGNHGAEIRLADGRRQVHSDDRARALCICVRDAVAEAVGGLPGVWVEDKGTVIAMHYRQADASTRTTMWERLSHWRIGRPSGVREREGNAVTEFYPSTLPSKGDALFSIARSVGVTDAAGIVYIGDDETDEEAFRALGPTSIAAKVGARDQMTSAWYWIDGPAEVRTLLERLAVGQGSGRQAI